MARKKREWYPGAQYHIMFRGVRRLPIFQKEEDYELFLHRIQIVQEQYPFTLHCFCEMTNHVHLLMTTQDTQIWIIMKTLLSGYAMDYNHRYRYAGHVFDSRYTSKLIENPVYFLEVSRYIHLNPVRAGMVRAPGDYRYSSYNCYTGSSYYSFLDTEKVFSFFKNSPVDQYRMFVEDAVSHSQQEKAIQYDIKEDEHWLPW